MVYKKEKKKIEGKKNHLSKKKKNDLASEEKFQKMTKYIKFPRKTTSSYFCNSKNSIEIKTQYI